MMRYKTKIRNVKKVEFMWYDLNDKAFSVYTGSEFVFYIKDGKEDIFYVCDGNHPERMDYLGNIKDVEEFLLTVD